MSLNVLKTKIINNKINVKLIVHKNTHNQLQEIFVAKTVNIILKMI